jgi:hyaluronoglucosaminidase
VVSVLRRSGASRVDLVGLGDHGTEGAALNVIIGQLTDRPVADALRAVRGSVPGALPAEGYALAAALVSGGGMVVLAGADGDGTYYAAQTLRQLAGVRTIAGAGVTDYPLMSTRGAIEGFYGAPWSHAVRLDQLAFYGEVKLNTYIHSPKDDPYLRERWRDPYPAAALAQLGELVRHASEHHVRFTFALSPGLSLCYTRKDDWTALLAKLQAMYDVGVRRFSIPLDDIDYTTWTCDSDQAIYGTPSQRSAARAQADLLNRVQKEFLDPRPGTRPLQMVPTEYGDVADTAYKETMRELLDRRVEVMWTGTDVVPKEITVGQAARADSVWGRKVLVWDNYPVNDYDQSEGRLLLAPYDKRTPGLHREVAGIVLNPMNQAAPSKVALAGGADFTWHDTGYDAQRVWRDAADYLAGGDARTTEALLAFFDVEHLAPTSASSRPWQPQAPKLARRLDGFRYQWSAGDKAGALDRLRPYAELLDKASSAIRSGVVDKGFADECGPWLRALELWGRALLVTLNGLRARLDGDTASADQRFAEAARSVALARAIHTIPGTTRPQGPVRVADGVLDVFLTQAPGLG